MPVASFIPTLNSEEPNFEEDISVRRCAVRSLSEAARNQKDLSAKALAALVQISKTAVERITVDTRSTPASWCGSSDENRFIGATIVSIGLLGEIDTCALLELWSSDRFQKRTSTAGPSFIMALGYTGDVKALDFLLSRLRQADLKRHQGALFHALGLLGRQFQGNLLFDYESVPVRPPDIVSWSKVRAALEQGLQSDNHPITIEVAAEELARITEKGDIATISRLRRILPYLESSAQNRLEKTLDSLEEPNPVVNP